MAMINNHRLHRLVKGSWIYLWRLDKNPGYLGVYFHFYSYWQFPFNNFPLLPWCMWLVPNKLLLPCCNTVLIRQSRERPCRNRRFKNLGMAKIGQIFTLFRAKFQMDFFLMQKIDKRLRAESGPILLSNEEEKDDDTDIRGWGWRDRRR